MGGDGKGVDISSAERCCACEPPRGVNERRLISCVSQAGVRGERVTDRTRIPSCEPQVGTAGIYFCSVSPNLQDLVLIGLFDPANASGREATAHASLVAAPKNKADTYTKQTAAPWIACDPERASAPFLQVVCLAGGCSTTCRRNGTVMSIC